MANTYYDSTLTAGQIDLALKAISDVIVPANNGKILVIQSGKIKAKSAGEIGQVTLEPLSVTENGDYTPEAGVDGFDEVHVAVPNSYSASDEGKVVNNGALVAQTARASQITQNGTYDTTLNNEVTVNVSGGSAVVQPLSVTQNGIYSPPSGVDGYAPVTVNVSGGGGGSTILAGIPVPDNSIGSDGEIYLRYSGLPSGYTLLDYIESTGTQYIDTGVKATNLVDLEMTFSNYIFNGDTFLFGYRPDYWTGLGINNGGSGSMWWYYGGNGNAGVITKMTEGTIKVKNGKRTVNGVETTFSTVSFSNDFTMFLFAVNNATNIASPKVPVMHSKYRLHSCKIWESDVLCRWFVPVKNSGNTPGLYDLVNNVFYANEGSGDFTPGSESITPLEPVVNNTYAKVNGVWQPLIGTDINDVTI